MTGIIPKFERGPVTYEVSAVVRAGRIVEPDGVTGKVKEAAAASVTALGVATTDAQPTPTANTTDAFGNQVISMVAVDQYTAVGGSDAIYPVEYSANAAFGQMLVVTAAGTVAPAGATPDARTIVGQCREPGGVVFATKSTGLAKIFV
jgi:hypothetical protein